MRAPLRGPLHDDPLSLWLAANAELPLGAIDEAVAHLEQLVALPDDRLATDDRSAAQNLLDQARAFQTKQRDSVAQAEAAAASAAEKALDHKWAALDVSAAPALGIVDEELQHRPELGQARCRFQALRAQPTRWAEVLRKEAIETCQMERLFLLKESAVRALVRVGFHSDLLSHSDVEAVGEEAASRTKETVLEIIGRACP